MTQKNWANKTVRKKGDGRWTLLSLEQDFKRSRLNQQLPLSWKSFSSFKNMEFAGRRITNFEMHTKWAHYFEFTITRPRHFFALALEIVRKIIHSPTFLQHLMCIGLLGQIRGSHFHRSAQIGSAWTSKLSNRRRTRPTGWQMSCHEEVNLFGLIMNFLGGYGMVASLENKIIIPTYYLPLDTQSTMTVVCI